MKCRDRMIEALAGTEYGKRRLELWNEKVEQSIANKIEYEDKKLSAGKQEKRVELEVPPLEPRAAARDTSINISNLPGGVAAQGPSPEVETHANDQGQHVHDGSKAGRSPLLMSHRRRNPLPTKRIRQSTTAAETTLWMTATT